MELSQEVKVVKGFPAGWGACFRTVTLSSNPWTLACWKDTIAVGLHSGDIITLDRITGTQTAILSGHTDLVRTLAFLPDGTSLVSGSDDMTIKLWDVQTGGVVKTLYGHTDWVVSVSISADCTMIASGSRDNTMCLWYIQTEECHQVKMQDVTHVMFSPADPQHLTYVSLDRIWHWNVGGHKPDRPVQYGYYVVYSPDGAQFAWCEHGNITVQNFSSGSIVARFRVDISRIQRCCFSPDGRLIAVAAGHTTYVWDTTSSHSQPLKTFVGHTEAISSLAFSSSSLISSSHDRSVKFWEIDTLQTDPVMTDPEPTPLTSPPITSITLPVGDGIAISGDSEGVVRTWDISTGLCKGSSQTPAKAPEWSDVQLINSRPILVWHKNVEIHMWDVEKGELQIAVLNQNDVEDVKISEDGSIIFCLRWRSIQAWSMQTREIVGEVGLEACRPRRFLTVDGSRVWVHSPLSEPLGWEFGTPGSLPVQLSNTSFLHPNDTKLWDAKQFRIKDAVTGRVVFQLAGRFARPHHYRWDGQHLVAGYKSGEVLILDFNHMFL